MAITAIDEFIGFETGGLEEASATTGSPDATGAIVVETALGLSGFLVLQPTIIG